MFKAWFGEGQAEVQDVHHLSQNFPLGEREKKNTACAAYTAHGVLSSHQLNIFSLDGRRTLISFFKKYGYVNRVKRQ